MQRRMKIEPQILPEQLVNEILLRLPVKSLTRFKCVSKLWLTLISDPQFVKSHFNLSRNQRLSLLVNGAPEITSIDFNASLLQDDSTSSVPIPHGSRILGSCRGFIVLHYFPNFCIWNPCTHVQRKLPSSPIYNYTISPIYTFLRGFGYDASTDDYLITIACRERKRGNEKIHLEIFSLRANAWEQFEITKSEILNAPDTYFSKKGLFFNGAIHWIAYGYEQSVDVIVAFDFTERAFTVIALPGNLHDVIEFCELRIIRGFLSICIASCEDIGCETWMMKEYKVQSSWTKSYVFLSLSNISTEYFIPICCTEGGDIVGTDGYTELVKFNDKGEVLELRDYYDPEKHVSYDWVKKCSVVMHKESLFSLP